MAIIISDEQTDAYQKRYSRLLAILQEKRGQWVTRPEIVAALGITIFHSGLAFGMECLASVGLIESRRVSRRWEYRIKP